MKKTDINTGFYGETNPLVATSEDKLVSIFRDAPAQFEGDKVLRERQMEIKGRPYRIVSVFPTAPKSTPTEKIIELMDLKIKNKVV